MKKIFPLLIIILAAGRVNAQFYSFAKVDYNDGMVKENTIYADNMQITISNAGKVVIENSFDKKKQNMRLPLPKDCVIRFLQYTTANRDLYIEYEYTNFNGSAGIMICIDKTQMKIKWRINIPAFNLGEPLYYNDCIYVTGRGFAGKVDVFTGRYLWSYKNLYEAETEFFTWFDKPIVRDDIIIFPESKRSLAGRKEKEAKQIEIDDKTGRILRGVERRKK